MKAATLLKFLIALAAGAALYLYFDHTRGVAAATNEYNRIVAQLINQRKHAAAVEALEKLLPTAPDDMKPAIRSDIAAQCVIIGDDPGLPIAESAAWFKRAHGYDPAALSDQQRQVMKLGERPDQPPSSP